MSGYEDSAAYQLGSAEAYLQMVAARMDDPETDQWGRVTVRVEMPGHLADAIRGFLAKLAAGHEAAQARHDAFLAEREAAVDAQGNPL